MKRYQFFTLLTILLSWFGGIDGLGAETMPAGMAIPTSWTAQQAVAFAIAGNPDSTVAKKRLEQALAAAREAHAADSPQISVSTEYSQTDNPMYSFGNILNQGAFDNRIDFNNPGRTDNLQIAAQLQYRLYNGGKDRADQAVAQANIKMSQTDITAVHQQLAFEVVKTFQAIIQAEQMVTVREEALASIGSALDVGQARYEAGDLLRQDLLNLELQQSRAEEELIRSRHHLELTRRIFLNLLGLSEGELTIDRVGSVQQEVPESIDYHNHYALTRLRALHQAALAELQKAQGGRLPTVDAFAGYQVDNGWVLNEAGNSWMTGVRLNYTLFDGGKTAAAITRAQLKLQEIAGLKKKTELALNLDLQQARLDYEQARKRRSVTEKMVAAASEATRLSRARFTEGVILASDLIDFEMRLSDAQARKLAAKASYQVAIANLRRAAGLEQFP